MNKYLTKVADAKDIRDTATIGAIGAVTGLAGVKALKHFPKLGSSNAKIMGITGGLGLLGDFAAVKANKAMEKKAAIDTKKLKGIDRHLHTGIMENIQNNPNTPKSDQRKIKALNATTTPAAIGASLVAGKKLGPLAERLVGKKYGALASLGTAVGAGVGVSAIMNRANNKLKRKNADKEFQKYAALKDNLSQKEKYIFDGAKKNAGTDPGILPGASRFGTVGAIYGGLVGAGLGAKHSKGVAQAAARKTRGTLQADPIANRAKNHGVRSHKRAVVVAGKTASPIHNPLLNRANALRKTKLGVAAHMATRIGGAIAGAAVGTIPGIAINRVASNAYGKKQVEIARKQG